MFWISWHVQKLLVAYKEMAVSQPCQFLLLGVLMPQHPAGYQHCSVRGHMAQSYPGTFSRVAVAMV
jgi:hypothetical protein